MPKTKQLAKKEDVDALAARVEDVSTELDEEEPSIIASATVPKALVNSAAGHNGIYRGKDLTNIYTIDQICQMVSDGTFEDLYIGDYITVTISTSYASNEEVDILFAGFNTYLNRGSSDNKLKKNHITCVTKDCFKTMSTINGSTLGGNTEGGYKASSMHNTVLPIYASALQSVLNDHILTHEVWMTNAVDDNAISMVGRGLTGASTGAEWVSTELCLMSEVNVFGTRICSSSLYDIGERNVWLPLFRMNPELKTAHKGKNSTSYADWWFSAVSYSTRFVTHHSNGINIYASSSSDGYVRPYFLIG